MEGMKVEMERREEKAKGFERSMKEAMERRDVKVKKLKNMICEKEEEKEQLQTRMKELGEAKSTDRLVRDQLGCSM